MFTPTPETIAVPVEDGALVYPCVTQEDGSWIVAWCHDGGRHKVPTGLTYPTSKAAIKASKVIRERIEEVGS